MDTLFRIAFALMAGLLMSRLAKKLGLPAVTAYLVAGICIGPFGLGALGLAGVGFNTLAQVSELEMFSNVALGFIAFAIGNEFRVSQLRKTGRQAAIIGCFQAVLTSLIVMGVLFGCRLLIGDTLSAPMVLCLAAIAAATAPAATLMVVRQYKAKGEVTDLLLPIVALDDAVGLMLFAVCFGVSRALLSGRVSVASTLVEPMAEIFVSLLLGCLMGLLFTFLERFFHSNSKRQSLSITFVILTVAFSMTEFELGGIRIGFSPLLACMMLGTVFCNLCDFSEELMTRVDKWTAPLFILFFVLSGAELDFSVFSNALVIAIGLVYILARSFGKYFGARISASFVGCDANIRKYLGITLLPQAGVALGMSVQVAASLGPDGRLIRSIVLFGVLVYELVGPSLTKMALTKTGDIIPGASDSRGKIPGRPIFAPRRAR